MENPLENFQRNSWKVFSEKIFGLLNPSFWVNPYFLRNPWRNYCKNSRRNTWSNRWNFSKYYQTSSEQIPLKKGKINLLAKPWQYFSKKFLVEINKTVGNFRRNTWTKTQDNSCRIQKGSLNKSQEIFSKSFDVQESLEKLLKKF